MDLYEAAQKPGTLSNETMTHLMTNLLPSGQAHYEDIEVDGCPGMKDTQTKILSAETARFLNNQLIRATIPQYRTDERFDNDKGGFNEWMREELRSLYINYFDDYNARPLEALNLTSLHLLANFSDDEQVRTLSYGLLTLTSSVYGVQSNFARRMPVFHKETRNNNIISFTKDDAQIAHMAVLAGNFKYLLKEGSGYSLDNSSHLALMAATSRYRLPVTTLSIILEPSYDEYLQIFNHKNYEVYFNSRNFKISGGGWSQSIEELNLQSISTVARPLVIIPTKSRSTDYRDFFHFRGEMNPATRDNHCVTKNFACGIDLVIPENIPAECSSTVEDLAGWTFYNFGTDSCPVKWDFTQQFIRASTIAQIVS